MLLVVEHSRLELRRQVQRPREVRVVGEGPRGPEWRVPGADERDGGRRLEELQGPPLSSTLPETESRNTLLLNVRPFGGPDPGSLLHDGGSPGVFRLPSLFFTGV